MIGWPRRTLGFAGFTLTDYLRSRRFLVEFLIGVAMVTLFLSPKGSGPFNADQYFSVIGMFMLPQAAYTTWVILGRARRPEGYVALARPLGRSGFLASHYLASIGMTAILYSVLTLLVLALNLATNHPVELSFAEWLARSLPLLVDAAIIAAFITLIAPLVLTPWPRLAALALVVIAITSETDALGSLDAMPGLTQLHEVSSLALLPMVAGFTLAASHGYTLDSVAVLVQQLLLILVTLTLAAFAFERRELVLST